MENYPAALAGLLQPHCSTAAAAAAGLDATQRIVPILTLVKMSQHVCSIPILSFVQIQLGLSQGIFLFTEITMPFQDLSKLEPNTKNPSPKNYTYQAQVGQAGLSGW